MFKIFRLFLVGTITLILLASVAIAQKDSTLKAIYLPWAGYWTKTPADSTIKPGDGGNWESTFNTVTVAQNEFIFLGARNGQVLSHQKSCTLHVEGQNLDKLQILNKAGYKKDGYLALVDSVSSSGSNTHRVFIMVINPQPHFEWFKLKDTSATQATVDTAYFGTYCYLKKKPIPTLTNYGLLVLLVLLVISGIIVIRQRRKGAVRV